MAPGRGRFLVWVGAAMAVAACSGGPAWAAATPETFFTLSVSARDLTVETRINGTLAPFLSGGTMGGLVSSAPVDGHLVQGGNTVEFTLTPSAGDGPLSPAFYAALEIYQKGEVVNTMSPGGEPIFRRELAEDEAAALREGNPVSITEAFQIGESAGASGTGAPGDGPEE